MGCNPLIMLVFDRDVVFINKSKIHLKANHPDDSGFINKSSRRFGMKASDPVSLNESQSYKYFMDRVLKLLFYL